MGDHTRVGNGAGDQAGGSSGRETGESAAMGARGPGREPEIRQSGDPSRPGETAGWAAPRHVVILPPAPEEARPRAARSRGQAGRAGRRARWGKAAGRAFGNRWAPRVALCVILAFSVAGKAIDISQPCTAPCKAHNKHTLIFDEDYYVNAARVIAGIEPPKGMPYHGAPQGKDPNAEHPQLAKLAMAAGIKLFGDTPLGWRIGSVVFAAIALLALYALVGAAGGSGWLAAGAAAVMALDNLMLVHGRIGTLDIYAVAMMLVAGALYMRKRPLLAGLALGVAANMKEVALALALVVVLIEAMTAARRWTVRGDGRTAVAGEGLAQIRRLAIFLAAAAAGTLGLLWLLDALVPAYDPGTHTVYGGNPISHLAHMYDYAQLLKAKPHETGISSSPLAWLLDEKTINYAKVAVQTKVNGKVVDSHATIDFRGEINPFIIFLAIPAFFAAAAAAWRRSDRLAMVGVCWCLGTYLPLLIGSLVSGRISYLYYMLAVMPGVYIVTVRLFADRRLPRAAAIGWAVALCYGFVHLFPIRTLF